MEIRFDIQNVLGNSLSKYWHLRGQLTLANTSNYIVPLTLNV